MSQLLKIICSKCDFVDYPWGTTAVNTNPWDPRRHTYVLGNGQYIPLNSQKKWCTDCSKVTLCENIPSGDEISELVSRQPTSISNDNKDEIAKLRFSKHIAYFEQVIKGEFEWRDWASKRKAGRCLTCGSTKNEPIDLSKKGELTFIHPDCGGTLSLIEEFDPNAIHFMYKTPVVLDINLIKYDEYGFLDKDLLDEFKKDFPDLLQILEDVIEDQIESSLNKTKPKLVSGESDDKELFRLIRSFVSDEIKDSWNPKSSENLKSLFPEVYNRVCNYVRSCIVKRLDQPLHTVKVVSVNTSDFEIQLSKWLLKRKEVLDRCDNLNKSGDLRVEPDQSKIDPDFLEEPLRSMAIKAIENQSALLESKTTSSLTPEDGNWDQKLKEWLSKREAAANMRNAFMARGGHMSLKEELVNPRLLDEPLRTMAMQALGVEELDSSGEDITEDEDDLDRPPVISVQCELGENSFWLLGATLQDTREVIYALAEQKSFILSTEACANARAELTHPKKRLCAEVGWLLDISSSMARVYLELLQENPKALFTWEMPALARANILASAITLLPTETTNNEWVELITILASASEEIDAYDVVRQINNHRLTADGSGFPEVSDYVAIEHEINSRRRVFIESIKSALQKIPTSQLVEVMSSVAYLTTNNGSLPAPLLVDQLVDLYEVETKSTLDKGANTILELIEKIKNNASNGPEHIQSDITKLEQIVRNWDQLAQPIQLSHKSRGLDHDLSHNLAWGIRNLSLHLFNKHDMLDAADILTDLSKEIFAELPAIVETLDRDSNALEDIYQERLKTQQNQQKWDEDISYKTELGLIFKDTLAISPKGVQWKSKIYPLDSINKVRWGATNHYRNGIPTGTTYLIVFGNQDQLSRVETNDSVVYQNFVDRLWKAVCIRLISQLIDGIDAGKKYTFGPVVIDGKGVEVTKHKLLLSNERAYGEWSNVRMTNAGGSLIVSLKSDQKAYSELPYQTVNNVQILESVINYKLKKEARV